MTRPAHHPARLALPFAAALLLSACGGAEEADPAYEAGADDVSGGGLIVTEETPAVPVDVPDTPMTPVPRDTPTATPVPTPTTEPMPE